MKFWYGNGPSLQRIFVGTMGSPNIYFIISSSSIVRLPDSNFKNALIENGVDSNEDGQISYNEAEAVADLNVGGKNISDMTGIEALISLNTLDCSYNQLTRLDIYNNTSLRELNCGGNLLSKLYIGDNDSLEILNLSNMPDLRGVCVRQLPFPPAGITIDTTGSPNAYFTTNCYVNIPDPNFKNALISENVDKNKDGEISDTEAEAVTYLKVNAKSISDMTGIEALFIWIP